MGLYQLMLKLALSCGPLLVVEHSADDIRPFIWAGLMMVLAVIPLCVRAAPSLFCRTAKP